VSHLGLIAGAGRFPLEVARAARRHGHRVAAVAFRNLTAPGLGELVDRVRWLGLGELQAALDFLHECGVSSAVLAGKVSKSSLLRERDHLDLDERATRFLEGLPDLRDGSILVGLAEALEEDGIRLEPQAELVPHLFVSAGVLGRVHPTPDQWLDIQFGWPIALAIGGLDIGQTIAVNDRAVLAVEAIDGTDATIERAGKLGAAGLCIVKVAKPDQDPRFDLPAIGLETVRSAARAQAGVVAFEAQRTVVLDRTELVELANELGIALVAVGADGPAAVPTSRAG
jgi:DUF1009 family protein